jgi:hypothetical protein
MSEEQTPFLHPLSKDPRRISAIAVVDTGRIVAAVDHWSEPSITEIRAYDEPGQMGWVPYYAIYRGEHLYARVPAHLVMVVYADPTPDPQP